MPKFDELVRVTIYPNTLATTMRFAKLRQMIQEAGISAQLLQVMPAKDATETLEWFVSLVGWTETMTFADDLSISKELGMLCAFWSVYTAMGDTLDIPTLFASYCANITDTTRSGWMTGVSARQKDAKAHQWALLAPPEMWPDEFLTEEQKRDPFFGRGVFSIVRNIAATFRNWRKTSAKRKPALTSSQTTGAPSTT